MKSKVIFMININDNNIHEYKTHSKYMQNKSKNLTT